MSFNSFIRWYDKLRGTFTINPPVRTNESVMMVFGNSLAANSFAPTYATGGVKISQFDDRGWINWLARNSRMPVLRLYHSGLTGTNTQEANARINDILESPVIPGAVWFVLGGNEGLDGIPVRSTSLPTLVDMVKKFTGKGIKCLVSIDWGPHSGQPVLQAELNLFQRYMQIWCERNGAVYVDVTPPMVRSITEARTSGLSWTRSGTSLTINQTGHTYIVDDFVYCSGFGTIPDGAYRVTSQVANQYVVSVSNIGDTSGSAGVTRRTHIRNLFTSDGLHTNIMGASAIAAYTRDQFAIWPPAPSPLLATQGMDYMNLTGAGTVVAADLVSTGIPAFTATAGTVQGTLPVPSGSVATGWFVRTLAGGNASATVVCASVAKAAPMEHVNSQSVVTTNAASGSANFSAVTRIDAPTTTRANSVAISKGDWRLGVTGSGRLWLCCIVGGTTAASAPASLAVALSEALTPIGTQIVDGSVLWEVRLGWETGDVLVCVGQATLAAASELGVAVTAGNYTTACNSLTMGIFQSETGSTAGDIVDMTHGNNLATPYLRVGDTYNMRTPEFTAPVAASLICGFRAGTTAGLNTSTTFRFSNLAVFNMTYLGL